MKSLRVKQLAAAAGVVAVLAVLVSPSLALTHPVTSVQGRSATLSPTAIRVRDDAIIARNIIPSGQYGAVPPPPGADRQARMYDALTPLFDHVSERDLFTDFKSESLGDRSGTRESVPHTGVTIIRDAYHVPHIYGATRDDVTWGAGWVVAEDRGLLLNDARYISRLAAVDAPGISAINLIGNLAAFKPSEQTEAEVAKQTGQLLAHGAKGRSVLHDIDVYLRGINAYLAAHSPTTPRFTRTDIYAFNALKDQFVGEGGGDEAVRSQFLSALQQRLGRSKGLAVWNDLREANDPEAPASVPGTVQLQPPPVSTTGNVQLDAGSLSPTSVQAVAAAGQYPSHASNALLISGRRSATHHPIMVAGPQIGYYYPGLTLEMELEGPGISQRGAMSAPFPGYIFIGRDQDAAWTLTSAGLDQIDTYVETLCGHSVHRYLFDGRCRSMQFFDAGSLTTKAGTQEITFYRTVHGPVIGYARVHGRLVALSRKRASYGKDVLDLLFYHDLAHGEVHNVHQFFRAASQTPQTFNSFYIDSHDIGVFTSGLIPVRPRNVDPAMPIDGRGGEEWRGWVGYDNHPKGINPPNGQIVNWNNRTQLGYEAPDDNWSLGAVQRVDALLRNLGSGSNLTPARVTSAMNAAATQDIREVTLEPVLSKMLHTIPAPSRRAATMLALLNAWYRHGASRLDRTGNGKITDPGAAIMDAAFPLLARAWASTVLGSRLSDELASFVNVYDQPPGGQYTGWHVYMNKDLRTILGEPVRGRYAVRYCGGGNRRRCAQLLWSALNQAGNQLAAAQGPNPANWRASATAEKITFTPGLLPYKLRYTNRPSGIQQVISFGGQGPSFTG